MEVSTAIWAHVTREKAYLFNDASHSYFEIAVIADRSACIWYMR